MQYKTKENRDVKVWIDQIEREKHNNKRLIKRKKKREKERDRNRERQK